MLLIARTASVSVGVPTPDRSSSSATKLLTYIHCPIRRTPSGSFRSSEGRHRRPGTYPRRRSFRIGGRRWNDTPQLHTRRAPSRIRARQRCVRARRESAGGAVTKNELRRVGSSTVGHIDGQWIPLDQLRNASLERPSRILG